MSIEDKDCFIGIDVGTQGTKALLYHPATKSVIGRSSQSYGLDESTPGRAEQDPDIWVDAITKVLRDLSCAHGLSNNEKYVVRGIGVSGQQHGMVVLDEDCKVIRPAKLWCDVEAADQSAEFSKKIGKVVAPGFTAPKVIWLKENEPHNYERMKYCCLPHDYINFLLTGEKIICTDAGDASGQGVFDTETRSFDTNLAVLATGDEKYSKSLPRVLEPNEIAGFLSPKWKRLVDIDINDDTQIVVSAGSGDNMCSALGCGCVEQGKVVLSLGTSGTIFAVSNETVSDKSGIVAPFCDATGHHLPLICVMSCTGVLQEVLENWCVMGGVETHAQAEQLASMEPAGCYNINFLPYLSGERTPNWPHATGAILGLSKGKVSPGLIYRAALEGITYNLFDGLENMRRQSGGFEPTSLICVGGGSKNKLWRQIISDVFNLPLQFPTEPESAALGAAFQAGAAALNIPVDKYVLEQDVPMEKDSVYPTKDAESLANYKVALERHRQLSSKLFGSA
uniref:glycerol kinase n=1 Tax=Leptocylindrus danicus TaxID=163516 RepID=A0A7S2K2R5_9STRA|mmetsp:Transcript_15280/g.22553  ORF Transcript_15280/g.22553 Transcript_15280/m.22553 type:complete len:508 (+) Transcript_15280:78-1601(+)